MGCCMVVTMVTMLRVIDRNWTWLTESYNQTVSFILKTFIRDFLKSC